MRKRTITEARPVVLTEAMDATSGVFELQLISPGIGSCGAYPLSVLESAARDGAFPKGTHLYLDHPTATEEAERPERSVRDLAGALTEAARWNGEALVAKARVYSTYRPLLAEAAGDIGMSIRATATVAEGEYEGQRMPVVQQIHEGLSVDFVTHAGRGGAVLAVIESARAQEAGTLDSDRREAMQAAVADSFGDAWIRDYDDDVIYVERYGDDAGTFRQGYTTDDSGAVTLTGVPVEVVAHTTYVPVAPAADSTTQEATMTPEEQAEMARLQEAAGRSSAAETARIAAEAERDAARRELAEVRAGEAARTHARTRVGAPTADLPAATIDRIVEAATRTVPLTDAGRLDTAVLDAAVDTARTAEESYLAGLREAAGAGKVTGFGPPAATTATSTEARPPSRTFGHAQKVSA